MADEAPLADRLATLKAALSAACAAYLAGDPGAWQQAVEAQAELEALRSTTDADVVQGPAPALPTCRHPGCKTITLDVYCDKHRQYRIPSVQ
jgi:hypothetical protein